MHSLRVTVLLLMFLGVSAFAVTRSARADDSMYINSKAELSRHMEDLMHYLLRGEASDVQHVGIELRDALSGTIAAANDAGLSEMELEQYSEIFDDVAALTEQASEGDLEKATDYYLDIVNACFDCHYADRELASTAPTTREAARSATRASS